MTETRQQDRQSSEARQATDEEVAAAIAIILAAGAPASAVAFLLGVLPDAPGLDVRNTVAALIVAGATPLDGTSEVILAAQRDNLIYKGHYAINALRRIDGDMQQGSDLRSALEDEAQHLAAHREAGSRREAGARLNDAAAQRWGPVLSWNHLNRTKSHRPAHVAADGANYRVDVPPASTEGMFPAMALHCDCVPGPPIEGARLLR